MAEDSEVPELEWIRIHNELQVAYGEEGALDRIKRKTKENPLIPLGTLATVCALCYGLWSFRKGNRKMSQYMMRSRVVAQGFTIIAIVTSMVFTATKKAKEDNS